MKLASAGHFLIVFVCVLTSVPFLGTVLLAFTDFSFSLPGHDGNFVALANFRRALEDRRLVESAQTQLLFLLPAVLFEAAFGVGLALLISRSKLTTWLLPAFALPMVMAPVTVGMVWKLALHGDYGLLGYHISDVTGRSVLGSFPDALIAIVLVDLWQWTPLFLIGTLAALRTVPPEEVDAAYVDGAFGAGMLRHLVLPRIMPSVLVLLLIRLIDLTQEYDKAFFMTRGGPASTTELLNVYLYTVAFVHGDLGYAAAVSVVLLAFVFACCSALFFVVRPRG